MKIKNRFYCEKSLEYMEKFDILGDELKDYIIRKSSENFIFAKFYIKTKNNEEFINIVHKSGFESFSFSQNKKIIIGVISSNNMGDLKSKIMNVWKIYRENMNKKEFVLGKQ